MDTSTFQPLDDIEMKHVDPFCTSEPLSDYCVLKGDIRIHGNASTIFVASSHKTRISAGHNSWTLRPYPRKYSEQAMNNTRKWTVKLVKHHENMPSCTHSHIIPAILFSFGGFLWNHFHDFSDLVIPLYSTSRNFKGEVQFLGTDYRPNWIAKFSGILNKLSRHEIIDIDKDQGIHCYGSLIIGLKKQEELTVDTSNSPKRVSMKDLRQLLRRAYSLKRSTAIKVRPHKHKKRKPRLMIISRKTTRTLLNEDKVAKMARKMGFDVVLDDAIRTSNLSTSAKTVNSCDVLMGLHGAGLTNMVFLPDNGVVIQVVFQGGIDELADRLFGKPTKGMKLRYLGYKIRVKESSLIHQYPLDDAVFRDPLTIHRQGWKAITSTYFDKQNVTIDLHRFRATLSKALKLLHR
ncbi:hypothetical protein RJ640_025675 [Escallonia rubra]|uniref:Glycosyltransferase 61 catalytic domain-containing protein n=1 Tax=Escallonia rubra TaxID=112253 RepID=A0AA88UTZ0_9ASTE|nr:hypothetical protein RJ640_025675 [Escallonia rubra]